MKYETILTPNLIVALEEFQSKVQQGWSIDPTWPPSFFQLFEIHLVKDAGEKPKTPVAQESDTVRKAAGRPPKAKP